MIEYQDVLFLFPNFGQVTAADKVFWFWSDFNDPFSHFDIVRGINTEMMETSYPGIV